MNAFWSKELRVGIGYLSFSFSVLKVGAPVKNSMSQITSRSYLSWRLELLAGHMYGIRRVIFPQTPAHVDSSFNFRLYNIFRQEYLQNFTFSTPPSSRSTFAAHGFSILSTIDSYYLNYRSVHSGFSISGFVPTELPVPPGPLSFPLCVLSLITCLSFSHSGFGGKGEKGGFLKSVWRGWSSTIESQTLLRTERGKPEVVWLFCSGVSSLCTLNSLYILSNSSILWWTDISDHKKYETSHYLANSRVNSLLTIKDQIVTRVCSHCHHLTCCLVICFKTCFCFSCKKQ